MPVDYSKWDALELSDDSDIEVHPNVDKRSFIRAKQNQIHQDRYQRKHEIATLKYERTINDGFLQRIEGLLKALQSHKSEAESRSPDELMFVSVMESAPKDSKADMPPPRPEGVHSQEGDVPSYSKMMATLVDQVKNEVDAAQPGNRYDAYVAQVIEHQKKVSTLQTQLTTRLSELEKIEASKITSESYSTGFDRSAVSKPAPAPVSSAPKKKVQAVEVLNPNALGRTSIAADSSGADADVDEPAPVDEEDDDEEDVEPTELGKAFCALPRQDYRAYLNFISQNPSVLAERETDGLLVLAFNSQLKGKDDFARQCVHQALLLQYCRSLGKDGVGLFFKRITTQGHQAQSVFIKDVNETYQRIRTRSKEILKQREEEETDNGGVEQIQLHAVDPGTSITINIPPEHSDDEATQQARSVFESFSPGLRRALESGSLDEVNKVLGKMSVEEAEEVVGQLGESGMLGMEEGVIDCTTEEGQAALKDFEAQERAALAAKKADEPAGDPE